MATVIKPSICLKYYIEFLWPSKSCSIYLIVFLHFHKHWLRKYFKSIMFVIKVGELVIQSKYDGAELQNEWFEAY